MKVIDLINQSSKTLFSFELLPPLKGNDASKIYNTIENLMILIQSTSTSPRTATR